MYVLRYIYLFVVRVRHLFIRVQNKESDRPAVMFETGTGKLGQIGNSGPKFGKKPVKKSSFGI